MTRLGRKRAAGLTLIFLVSLTAVVQFVLPQRYCPPTGAALAPSGRELMRLKNRDAEPSPRDFDDGVTLEALLRRGEDRARWSESRAGRVEGYVVEVVEGGVEAANCYSYRERDTHVHVAPRADAPRTEWVVVEVTPRAREGARRRGLDWTTEALRRELVGRRCRFEGWLLFDRGHADESENTAPGARGNWRGTAWELHPVTAVEVLK
jgi:hypothetical protein